MLTLYPRAHRLSILRCMSCDQAATLSPRSSEVATSRSCTTNSAASSRPSPAPSRGVPGTVAWVRNSWYGRNDRSHWLTPAYEDRGFRRLRRLPRRLHARFDKAAPRLFLLDRRSPQDAKWRCERHGRRDAVHRSVCCLRRSQVRSSLRFAKGPGAAELLTRRCALTITAASIPRPTTR